MTRWTTFFRIILAIPWLVVAMVYVPLNAMRVGLLTRFFATLGMALAASLTSTGRKPR